MNGIPQLPTPTIVARELRGKNRWRGTKTINTPGPAIYQLLQISWARGRGVNILHPTNKTWYTFSRYCLLSLSITSIHCLMLIVLNVGLNPFLESFQYFISPWVLCWVMMAKWFKCQFSVFTLSDEHRETAACCNYAALTLPLYNTLQSINVK